jgi:hypothetical protein
MFNPFSGLADYFWWVNDSLTYYFAVAIGILLVLLVIGWFLPLKSVRLLIGGAIMLMGAFLAGAAEMHEDARKRLEAEKAKERERQSTQQWKWPWQ